MNAASSRKVEVDHAACEGNRRCEATAPLVFEVRDDELSYVLLDPVPADQADAVERAIRLCPRQAIAWANPHP